MSGINENNPIVILDNITLDLTDDVIAEMTMGMGQVDGLIVEATAAPAAATPATATPAAATPIAATPAADVPAATTPAAVNDDDWFRAGPSKTPKSSRATPHPSFGRKNMALMKSLRSPSPTPSSISTQSSVAEDDSDDFTKFLEEEQRRRNEEEARRAEWRRLCAVRRADVEKKWARAREHISSLTGEGKRLKNQREALRAQVRALEEQLRALDDEEADLEKRKRSALKSERKYGSIVAKYREMDL